MSRDGRRPAIPATTSDEVHTGCFASEFETVISGQGEQIAVPVYVVRSECQTDGRESCIRRTQSIPHELTDECVPLTYVVARTRYKASSNVDELRHGIQGRRYRERQIRIYPAVFVEFVLRKRLRNRQYKQRDHEDGGQCTLHSSPGAREL